VHLHAHFDEGLDGVAGVEADVAVDDEENFVDGVGLHVVDVGVAVRKDRDVVNFGGRRGNWLSGRLRFARLGCWRG